MFSKNYIKKIKKSFSLVEMLIGISALTVLSAIVVFSLNPARLIDNSKDATRVSDIVYAHKAISFMEGWQTQGVDYGDDSKVYISLPSDNPDCSDLLLDLPELEDGYTYACAN